MIENHDDNPESLELFGEEIQQVTLEQREDSLEATADNGNDQEIEDLAQRSLVDVDEEWKREWQGMSEFIQHDLEPYKTIYVHFESRSDMEAFAKLVEQKLTFYTKSIWYPRAEIGRFINKRYVDEP